MRATSAIPSLPRREPEPTWEVAYLFPPQGSWSEGEYLALDTNRLVEFIDGRLEVLPVPTTTHQLIVKMLFMLLNAFVEQKHLGTVLFAGVRVKVSRRRIREPDVAFMRATHSERIGERYWKGADLVMEVVSPAEDDRARDLVSKRLEYAKANIPEYWIADPAEETVTVLRLVDGKYAVHGSFGKGEMATSKLLPGFAVDVTAVLFPPKPGKTNGKRPRKS